MYISGSSSKLLHVGCNTLFSPSTVLVTSMKQAPPPLPRGYKDDMASRPAILVRNCAAGLPSTSLWRLGSGSFGRVCGTMAVVVGFAVSPGWPGAGAGAGGRGIVGRLGQSALLYTIPPPLPDSLGTWFVMLHIHAAPTFLCLSAGTLLPRLGSGRLMHVAQGGGASYVVVS